LAEDKERFDAKLGRVAKAKAKEIRDEQKPRLARE
jgi:hypothetical protein